jgi:hypothetical protein
MRGFTFVAVSLGIVLVSLSCSDVRPTEPIGETMYDEARDTRRWRPPREENMADRSTRDGLLECYATAYSHQSLGMCDICLGEGFQFEFTSEVAESLGLPPGEPWWSKTSDQASAENMFRDRAVTDVRMSLARVTTWDICSEPRFNGGAYCARIDPDIRVTVQSPGGDTFTMLINNSWLDFIVEQDPDYPELWVISRITEVHQNGAQVTPVSEGAAAVESATWGMIKAMWAERLVVNVPVRR